ncbi:MAG: hypothetical protein AAF368_02815, partial [Planctomycetota bacterium]
MIGQRIRVRPAKRKQFVFAFRIAKPEFNLYDKETKTQILLASNRDTLGVVFREFLQFDIFEQDPKTHVKLIFNQVKLFTGPSDTENDDRFFWLDDTAPPDPDPPAQSLFRPPRQPSRAFRRQPTGAESESRGLTADPALDLREGQLNKILTAQGFNLSFAWFGQKRCDIDFTKEVDFGGQSPAGAVRTGHWANEIRCVSNEISVSSVDGFFDRLNFINFFKTISFIMKMNNSEYVERAKQEKERKMLHELERAPKEQLKARLVRILAAKRARRKGRPPQPRNKLVFAVERFNLRILEERRIFVMLSIRNLRSQNTVYEGLKVEKALSVETFGVQFLEDNQFKKAISLESFGPARAPACACLAKLRDLKDYRRKCEVYLDSLYKRLKAFTEQEHRRRRAREDTRPSALARLLRRRNRQLIDFFSGSKRRRGAVLGRRKRVDWSQRTSIEIGPDFFLGKGVFSDKDRVKLRRLYNKGKAQAEAQAQAQA